MDLNNFERIKILFIGSQASKAEINFITGDQSETQSINLHETVPPEPFKIVGVEIVSGPIIRQRIVEAVETEHPEKISGYYFFARDKKHIHAIVRIINELSLGKIDIYGVDPDYYFSLVPLDGKNHKVVEKYILYLKNDWSIGGIFKNIIKRLLVYLNLSGKLYEGFVITVSRLPQSLSGLS